MKMMVRAMALDLWRYLWFLRHRRRFSMEQNHSPEFTCTGYWPLGTCWLPLKMMTVVTVPVVAAVAAVTTLVSNLFFGYGLITQAPSRPWVENLRNSWATGGQLVQLVLVGKCSGLTRRVQRSPQGHLGRFQTCLKISLSLLRGALLVGYLYAIVGGREELVAMQGVLGNCLAMFVVLPGSKSLRASPVAAPSPLSPSQVPQSWIRAVADFFFTRKQGPERPEQATDIYEFCPELPWAASECSELVWNW